MLDDEFSGMSVAEIMYKWPATIRVFIDLRMHCVGCPVAAFQTLSDAAVEHGLSFEHLAGEIAAAVAGTRTATAAPVPAHPRSAAAGAGPSPGVSGGHLRPAAPPPRR